MSGLCKLWLAVETVAFFLMCGTAIAAIVTVIPSPGMGHSHWEAATILLFCSLGLDVLASVAHVTARELKGRSA